VSPSVRRGRLRGLRRRRLARSDQLRAVRLVLLRRRGRGNGPLSTWSAVSAVVTRRPPGW